MAPYNLFMVSTKHERRNFMESRYINLIPERNMPTYHFSQNDNGRVIRCELYDGVKAFKLSGTENIRIRYIKPDGSISSISVTNTSDTYVDITIPATMTDIKGKVYCKLRINGIGAKAFILEVEERP